MFKDSLLTGIMAGILAVIPAAVLWFMYSKPDFMPSIVFQKLRPPAIQLILLGFYLIIFRFMIVKWNKPEMAKGFFLVLFLSTLIMFFLLKKSV